MIKYVAKQLLDGSARSTASMRRGLARAGLRRHQALIIPPTTPGSLGDEAMMVALVDALRKRNPTRVSVLDPLPTNSWNYINGIENAIVEYETGVFNRVQARFSRAMLDDVYLLGADVLDGYYSEERSLRSLDQAATAAQCGARVTIVGFSFNDQPLTSCINRLRALPRSVRICARDPISHRRLEHALGRPVILTADMAFQLAPNSSTEAVRKCLAWIKAQKQQSRQVLGLNLNGHLLKASPTQGASAVIPTFADLVSTLVREHGVSILLLPHDKREVAGDLQMASQLLASLSTEIHAYAEIADLPTAAEIKAICESLDAAVSGRMHLAIACLGQGTPVGGIVYQGKFEGLYEHFGLSGLTLSPELAFQREPLCKFVLELLARSASLRSSISQRLPAIQALSASNLRN